MMAILEINHNPQKNSILKKFVSKHFCISTLHTQKRSKLKLYITLHYFLKIYTLSKYIHTCYGEYKQTFILLKRQAEMIKNNTF